MMHCFSPILRRFKPTALVAATIASLIFLAPTSTSAFNQVVLDAGHGGYDRGGGVGSYFEKHFALDTTRRVAMLLRQNGLDIVLTRTDDTYISLEARSDIANRHRNAIFVSIHFNEYHTNASGLETFYYHKSSYPLARYIQSYTLARTRAKDRSVKRKGFAVIRRTTSCPAVLVECAFLSNSAERARCCTGAYRQALAEGIAQGILEYRAAYNGRGR